MASCGSPCSIVAPTSFPYPSRASRRFRPSSVLVSALDGGSRTEDPRCKQRGLCRRMTWTVRQEHIQQRTARGILIAVVALCCICSALPAGAVDAIIAPARGAVRHSALTGRDRRRHEAVGMAPRHVTPPSASVAAGRRGCAAPRDGSALRARQPDRRESSRTRDRQDGAVVGDVPLWRSHGPP